MKRVGGVGVCPSPTLHPKKNFYFVQYKNTMQFEGYIRNFKTQF